MSHIDKRFYTNVEKEDKTILHIHPASKESIETVLNASEDGNDGRSNWLWIRLENGDLIFGCFPQGDTYLSLEQDAVYL